ncbi:uncharacterized protein LOC135109037 isoform X2 [Scylla paramamosain]|uniref:uncharacterized protein LOC135109037 isoform X2 n=1 Tax=Scylla paramamosain TaxID=85552 RepID=UPI003082E253
MHTYLPESTNWCPPSPAWRRRHWTGTRRTGGASGGCGWRCGTAKEAGRNRNPRTAPSILPIPPPPPGVLGPPGPRKRYHSHPSLAPVPPKRCTGHGRPAEGGRKERQVSAHREHHSIASATSEGRLFPQHMHKGWAQRGLVTERTRDKTEVSVSVGAGLMELGIQKAASGEGRTSKREAAGCLSEQQEVKAKRILIPTPQGNNLNEDIAPSRRRDGDVSAVTSQFLRRRGGEDAGAMGGVQYRDRLSFPASYPGVTATARGSPPGHPSPQTAITAAAGRRERRKQNWKTWRHNLHLHVKDKSESTSQFPLGTKNKSVTGWHDPLAQAARNDHLGTPAHDFQMRNVSASRKLRLPRFLGRGAHVEVPPPDQPQGNPLQGSGRGKRQLREGPGEARCAVNTVPLSAAANATLSVANGIRQDLSPLSSHTDRHPDPPGAGPTDHRAPHGSLFAGSTKRGSLEARKSSRLKVMEKIPSRHGREDKDASPSEHKASEGQGDAAEERNMPRTLHQTNLESPATTNRILSSGGVTISKVTRESGQEALTPSPLKGSSCEGVQVLGGVGGGGGGGGGGEGSIVHVVDTVVTVVVKDINDNAPVFPNTTMLGHVQENGPAGEAVVVVLAWDADDASDGTNARLTYAIQKNVVDEGTGAAIFSMESATGLVRTARCCLDRETTPEYQIQVVASDGGGLKGTGTVVIRVDDQNDNSPRLARRLWELQVEETPSTAPPPNTTLLELTAADRDAHNTFLYRVVPDSGHGWENFGVRSVGAAGQLFALRGLDYELETHRRGFRFMVQVTDQGPWGWEDLQHVDSAWVTVRLLDVNDNPPLFSRPHAHVTVKEDAAPGTSLATLSARDPDAGSRQGVDYRLKGDWEALAVDGDGSVSLVRQLDREAPDGEEGVVLVVAVDRGSPPLSATATLTITVTDVNDCPPRLLPPTLLHVTEGSPPTKLGVLRVTDPDVWELGHGPPFFLSLAPTNTPLVLSLISLKFDPRVADPKAWLRSDLGPPIISRSRSRVGIRLNLRHGSVRTFWETQKGDVP